MRSLALILTVLCLAGCTTRTSYTDGTSTALGLYVPVEGQIYGCQLVSYLSGCKVSCASNNTLHVSRTYSATNSYFGIVTTVESSKTDVDVSKP
jgi:hypothetical protein